MARSDSYRLTHPEMMTESELSEILTNRCIEIHDFDKMSKIELLEIYNRVALPLPQRRSKGEESNNSDTGTEGQDQNTDSDNDKTSLSNVMENEETRRTSQSYQSERLKPDFDELNPSTKKVSLSSSAIAETEHNNLSKRTVDTGAEDQNASPAKKRLKITWP